VVGLACCRTVAVYLQTTYDVSERHCCRLLSLHRSSKRNRPKSSRDIELVSEIHLLSDQYPRFGYRKIYYKLKENGWEVGRERVRIIRKQEGLQVVVKKKKKRRIGKSKLIGHGVAH
jgi:putative transposase